ncbi:MAG: hypothetical protein JKY08_05465 [Flavobacteriaceae bacterium]|nr:hypothetical protein [Flavobacteriaceae bacterium]
MNIVVDVNEQELKDAIELSGEMGLEKFIQKAIKDAIKLGKEEKMIDQTTLLHSALHEAHMKDEGDEFTLIELLGDSWSQVKSPKAFGRSFRKKAESMGIVTLSYKTSDNKAVYKRNPE